MNEHSALQTIRVCTSCAHFGPSPRELRSTWKAFHRGEGRGEGPEWWPPISPSPQPSPANTLVCNGGEGARERGLWLRHGRAEDRTELAKLGH